VIQICRNNYITFNKKQYKQTKGIPQGLSVSYILSSFYYANLEENVLGFLRKHDAAQASYLHGTAGAATTSPASSSELNLLMRLTDDYLLMTTEKNNAMLFIEKLCQLSQGNYFKFNMKKLKTNFAINYAKLNTLTTAGAPSSL
jgi:telomerase reverse transcriptase